MTRAARKGVGVKALPSVELTAFCTSGKRSGVQGKVFKRRRRTEYGVYRIALPSGKLRNVACAQAPSTIIEKFVIRKRVRRI